MKQNTHYLFAVLLLGTLTSIFSSGDLFSPGKSLVIYGFWGLVLFGPMIKNN